MSHTLPPRIQALLGRGLFEAVPFSVALIDRDYHVVAANENFEEYFGEWRGRRCHEVYKNSPVKCARCQAQATFEDGRVRVSDETGVDRHGRTCHYVVHLAPLKDAAGKVRYVLEMTTDLTETRRWQREYDLFFERVPCYVLVIDRGFRIVRANEKFRQAFGDVEGQHCYEGCKRQDSPCANCPAEITFREGTEQVSEQFGVHQDGSPAHYVVTTSPITRGEGGVSFVIEMATDITEKVETERLAAVGQTVAGLAHTIKNLLMGLEGGMYIVDSGLRRGDAGRISEGWEILQRNFEKTTTLVKDFLSFAKGRLPELQPVDPNALARGVVELYHDAAARQGVELLFEPGADVREAPLDASGMESCLTNLVSNAIDAAMLRDKPGGKVIVRTREDSGDIIFEVTDNGCGMEEEVKARVFTTFFTTKGGKGTGLGLLTTRKIVQEHGGRVEMESVVDQGSVFRIRLPRNRLEAMAAASAARPAPPEVKL
jgi:PAS domain S-box-containing protein